MTRTLPILLVVALVTLSLAACGRKGNPAEPDDAVYPRIYPYTALPGRDKNAPRTPAQTGPDEDFQRPQPRLDKRPDELRPPPQ